MYSLTHNATAPGKGSRQKADPPTGVD